MRCRGECGPGEARPPCPCPRLSLGRCVKRREPGAKLSLGRAAAWTTGGSQEEQGVSWGVDTGHSGGVGPAGSQGDQQPSGTWTGVLGHVRFQGWDLATETVGGCGAQTWKSLKRPSNSKRANRGCAHHPTLLSSGSGRTPASLRDAERRAPDARHLPFGQVVPWLRQREAGLDGAGHSQDVVTIRPPAPGLRERRDCPADTEQPRPEQRHRGARGMGVCVCV